MLKDNIARARRLGTAAAVAAFALGAAGCSIDDILRVEAPEVLTTDELQGPGEVSTILNGIYGAFNEQFDNYVLYSGLLTDEFIAAGTFPTRIQVDNRDILVDNGTVTDDVAEVMHRARLTADTAVVIFSAALDDEAFAEVTDDLRKGIAVGQLYGGFMRQLLAELYCETPIASGPVLSSDELATQALALFEAAQAHEDLTDAALVGKVRALMWLGRYDQAAAVADSVSDGFELLSEFSDNTPEQYNEVVDFTLGIGDQRIRWTVGDGEQGARGNERWPYFDEWVDIGLIYPKADEDKVTGKAFASGIPVNAQMKYTSLGDDIVLASRTEADLVIAEVAIRNGAFAEANAIINGYRAEWGLGPIDFADVAALRASFEEPLPASADSDLKVRLAAMARERARELWLTGDRQATLRRYYEHYGLDLYPQRTGTDVCFPIPQQELDNNDNL